MKAVLCKEHGGPELLTVEDVPWPRAGSGEVLVAVHAVSIVPGADACPPAVDLRAQRVLSKDAPPLPLGSCQWPWKCRCTYRHYADRRAAPRRAAELGRPERLVLSDRRETPGRRAEDIPGR